MNQYEKYKTADKFLFGEIPVHWAEYKMKYLVDPSRYYQIGDGDHGSIKPEMYSVEGGIPHLRVQNLSWSGELIKEGLVYITEAIQNENSKSKLIPDDILIAKTGATIGKLGIIPHSLKEANTTSSVGKITVNQKRFFPRFVLYSMMSKQFKDQIWIDASQKSAQPGFNVDDLVFYKIVAPTSLEEQTTIANFLDEKTEQIDGLIYNKQKLIDLLKEERTAIINETISGEGKNWERKKLKYVATIKYGLGQPPKQMDGGLLLIRATNVERGKINEKDLIFIDPEDVPYDRDPVLKENDIIVVRSGAYTADSAIIPKNFEGAITGYDMVVRVLNDNPLYIAFCLLSDDVLINQLYLHRLRAAQPHLNKEELGETLFNMPPIEEQIIIVQNIQTQTIRIEETISKIEKEIELMKEYRTALISEVVTGKVKV